MPSPVVFTDHFSFKNGDGDQMVKNMLCTVEQWTSKMMTVDSGPISMIELRNSNDILTKRIHRDIFVVTCSDNKF